MKECSTCGTCFPDNINDCPADAVPLKFSLRGDLVLDERYKLERRLGRGGMGIVFKASHVFLRSTHAVKVILPDLVGDDPTLVTRFRQEAIVAASIKHKNIVLVTDFGVTNSTVPFLVMELLTGRSLWDVLTARGRLSSRDALEVMEAIAAGVGAAHRRNIVHRDLKPLNIFIQEGMSIGEGLKVLDFGLAKIKSGDLFGSFIQAQTTNLMGSPLYMAPEQWSEGEPDARADIYSIGVMLYQMLAGETPFTGSSMPKIMRGHLMSQPPTFAALGVTVSSPVEAVVRRALEKDPRDRPSSVDEFVAELREAVGKEDGGPSASLMDTLRMDEMGAVTLPQVAGKTRAGGIVSAVPNEPLRPDEQSLLETQRQIEDEADRLMRELEDAQFRAEEARKRVEEAAQRRAEEDAARKLAEAAAARKRVEEEEALKRAEGEKRKRGEEELARKRAEEEKARKLAAEEAQIQAEEERARKLAEEESNRLSLEVEEARHRLEEARERAEEEAQGRAKEEAARRIAEERAARLAIELEEAQQRAEEAHKRAEEEERRRAEQEAERQLVEEKAGRERALEEAQRLQEEETARERVENDLGRLAREVEEAQRRVEEARERAEEEAQRRVEEEVARKRAEEEAIRLTQEVEEARRRAEDVRKLAEEEKRRHAANQIEGRLGRAIEVKATAGGQVDQEATLLSSGPRPSAAHSHDPGLGTQPASTHYAREAPSEVIAVGRKRTILPWALSLVVVVLLVLLGYGTYRLLQSGGTQTAVSKTVERPTESPHSIKSDMVLVREGTFMMGRNNVSEENNQWPAHQVTVKDFFMDRTEVTNAEYAEFVRQGMYEQPKDWPGDSPAVGREQWPVTSVSLDDARAFAAWRSARDGVKYRLPSEEEWEYAARGNSHNQLYPWGDTWSEDRANLGTGAGEKVDFPKPVGSYPLGASALGVSDLIGNVWEWTSSEASFYSGNNSALPSKERGWFVVRGGSHQSLHADAVEKRGSREFTASFRQWFPRDTKSKTLGFRLVRDGS